MHSTLIVARMDPSANVDVAKIFGEFDEGDMPHLMGTRRRQLFHYRGLYFHLQDFDETNGPERIEAAKTDYRCTPSRDGPRTTSYVGARRVLS